MLQDLYRIPVLQVCFESLLASNLITARFLFTAQILNS